MPRRPYLPEPPPDWPVPPRGKPDGWREHLFWAAVIVTGVLMLFSAASAFAKAPIVPRGAIFTCTPALVWDGDGPVWCREGMKVRLARINARERDGSCREGAPCPDAPETAARRELVRFLGGARGITRDGHTRVAGPPLRCRSDGWAKGDRTGAWCNLPDGIDLSAAMIATGTVAPWMHPNGARR